MANFDNMKFAVEAVTGGKNTVILDDMGMPSVMVRMPKMRMDELIDGATTETHPAWIVGGVERDAIYVSKFINIVSGDRAYSLPGKDPRVSVNFDQALQFCRNKGNGWSLMPGAAWAATALWSLKNGTLPRGNNNYGRDHTNIFERGEKAAMDGTNIGRTLTGSGPNSWSHNHQPDGILDMNGLTWEWTADQRLTAGEIQTIPNGDSMLSTANMGVNSPDWKAILPDGTLVAPGTEGTLKINGSAAGNSNQSSAKVGSPIIDVLRDKPSYTGGETNANYAYTEGAYEALSAASGVTIPNILKAIGLFPSGTGLGGDLIYVRNYGERLPIRGGAWYGGANAGVFATNFHFPRSYVNSAFGFRSAYVKL